MVEATVIIAAWNAEDSIADCVASARQQSKVTCEVVAADDASCDDTAARAHNAGARVVRLPENGGPAAARNAAIAAAQGDWIVVLDSDDRIEPGRTRRMIDLAQNRSADVVLGNIRRVARWEDAMFTPPFIPPEAPGTEETFDLESYLAMDELLPAGRSLGYLKPIFNRAFLDRNGLRYDPRLRNGEDFHIILACLATGGRVVFDPVADYLYRARPGSVSHRMNLDHLDALIAADERFAARHSDRLSNRSCALLARRRNDQARLGTSERVLRALKTGKAGSALADLAQHPGAAGMILGKLAEALGRRVFPERYLK